MAATRRSRPRPLPLTRNRFNRFGLEFMMHPTRNDMSEDLRTSMVKLLNDRLADAIHLQLQSKQAHWNVRGPHFRGLHLLFDQVFAVVQPMVDEIAERAAALGGVVEGDLKTVASRSKLPAFPSSASAGQDCVDALSKAMAEFGKQIRAAIETAEKAGDAGTADLFTAAVREIDMQLWMVESHLETPSGKSNARAGSAAKATAGAN